MSYFKRKGKFESGNLLLRVHDYLIWFCLGVFQFGILGFTAYSPSKFAVRGFAETLFMEVSKSLVQGMPLVNNCQYELIILWLIAYEMGITTGI